MDRVVAGAFVVGMAVLVIAVFAFGWYLAGHVLRLANYVWVQAGGQIVRDKLSAIPPELSLPVMLVLSVGLGANFGRDDMFGLWSIHAGSTLATGLLALCLAWVSPVLAYCMVRYQPRRTWWVAYVCLFGSSYFWLCLLAHVG